MQKTPTLFDRDWQDPTHPVVDVPNPACTWVFDGEGKATRKIDGSCCLVRDGKLLKRREIKPGQKMPENFEPVTTDETTNKIMGWVPVGDGKEDAMHREAFQKLQEAGQAVDGTYELLGPKVQGNPERLNGHELWPHAQCDVYTDAPRSFEGLKAWLAQQDIEGIVFHHHDGRMAKIKLRDFGFKRSN
jgi:hypothetical protein